MNADMNGKMDMRRPEGCDVARRLDARGLCCPMPSVKTSLALESMAGGEVIEVLTDDLISKRDLPRWAEATGNELLGLVEEDSTVRIYIRKGGGL